MACCCGQCNGCCMPMAYDSPLYPNGYATSVQGCFSAPSCPSLDGDCFTFEPIDPTSQAIGPCGPCIGYRGENVTAITGQRPSGIEVGSACMMTPCSVFICLVLECLRNTEAAPGIEEECCNRLRLWIGTNDLQSEDDGTRPVSTAGAGSCTSWKKVLPTSCICDPVSGISARFPFSLNFVCDPFGGSTACATLPNCCTPACDLSGAEIVI